MKQISTNYKYQLLVENISSIYEGNRKRALSAVNNYLLETNWQVGQYIVEYE